MENNENYALPTDFFILKKNFELTCPSMKVNLKQGEMKHGRHTSGSMIFTFDVKEMYARFYLILNLYSF